MEVVIDYKPHPLQEVLHAERKRWNLLICHRRFGKTVWGVNELQRGALTCQLPRPRFAYIAPQYKQAKAVAWDYLKHYARPIPGVRMHEAELRVDYPNGGQVRLYGADNPDSLRGLYLDGAVIDEPAQVHPALFSEVVRPALADRKGWAAFIGTPKGRNALYTLLQTVRDNPDWFVRTFRASETGLVDADELKAARDVMGEDEYEQEFECSFTAAIKGAYWADEINRARADGRVKSFPIEPSLPVHTYWDLGVGDQTCIWLIQNDGSWARVIACHADHSKGLNAYVNWLHDFRDQHGITFGQHWAPHDIEVRELSTGKTRKSIAAGLGIKFRVTPNIPVDDGISAARLFLRKCWFNEPLCRDGLTGLENYRREWDERRETFRDTPLHDWASDYADAFRYAAVAWRDQPQRPAAVQATPDFDVFR